ncbi:MAG: helix-turn-helix domain-containing protein [Moorellales bacterium]
MGVPVFPFLSVAREELGITARQAAQELGVSHGYLSQAEDFVVVPDPAMPVRPDSTASRPTSLGEAVRAFLERHGPGLPGPLRRAAAELAGSAPSRMVQDGLFHSFYSLLPGLADGEKVYRDILGLYVQEVPQGPEGWYFFRKTPDPVVNLLVRHALERAWGRFAGRRKAARAGEIRFVPVESPGSDFLGQVVSPGGWERAFLEASRAGPEPGRSFLAHLVLYVLTSQLSLCTPGTASSGPPGIYGTRAVAGARGNAAQNPCEEARPSLMLTLHPPLPEGVAYLLCCRQGCYCLRTSPAGA